MDKNVLLLEGTIAEDVAYNKLSSGRLYARIAILTETHKVSDMDSTKRKQQYATTRVMVFAPRLVTILRDNNVHRGTRVSMYGWVSTQKIDHRGEGILQNVVVAEDIHIVKK